jgi:hypothetical protein
MRASRRAGPLVIYGKTANRSEVARLRCFDPRRQESISISKANRH